MSAADRPAPRLPSPPGERNAGARVDPTVPFPSRLCYFSPIVPSRAAVFLPAVLFSLLVALPNASAGIARVRVEVDQLGRFTTVHFSAAPGEVNVVEAVDVANGAVRLRDAGAMIVPGTGCRAVTPNEVVCRGTDPADYVEVEAGDQDDVVAVGPCPPTAEFCTSFIGDGGSGNDTIRGDRLNDWLYGGPGDDRLEGRAGDDFFGGFTGADVFVGGRGQDQVGYVGRMTPVRADLDGAADDGEAGEGDTIGADIEDITGGSSDDRLTGNAADNMLEGGPGRDVIDSGGGDDIVFSDVFRCGVPFIVIVDPVIPRPLAQRGRRTSLSGRPRFAPRDAQGRVRAGGGRAERAREVRLVPDAGSEYAGGAAEDGADIVKAGAGEDNVNGCGGGDTLRLGPGGDIAQGGTGNDRIFGEAGRDAFWGNAGADLLVGGPGGEHHITADSGKDRILGGSGNDLLSGGAGDDIIRAGPGRDVLHGDERWDGGRGDDRMYACDGERDRLHGGRGDDRAWVDRFDGTKSATAVRCGGISLAGRETE